MANSSQECSHQGSRLTWLVIHAVFCCFWWCCFFTAHYHVCSLKLLKSSTYFWRMLVIISHRFILVWLSIIKKKPKITALCLHWGSIEKQNISVLYKNDWYKINKRRKTLRLKKKFWIWVSPQRRQITNMHHGPNCPIQTWVWCHDKSTKRHRHQVMAYILTIWHYWG